MNSTSHWRWLLWIVAAICYFLVGVFLAPLVRGWVGTSSSQNTIASRGHVSVLKASTLLRHRVEALLQSSKTSEEQVYELINLLNDSSNFPRLAVILRDRNETNLLRILASQWARTDPAAAISFAQHDGLDENLFLVEQIFTEWAKEDPAGAVIAASGVGHKPRVEDRPGFPRGMPPLSLETKILQRDEERRERWSAVGFVFSKIAEDNPRQAAALALDMDTILRRSEAVTGALSHWGKSGPAEALEWASTIDDSQLRSEATREVLSQWARKDPEAARDAIESIPNSFKARSVHKSLFDGLLKADPQEALDWMATNVPMGTRNYLFESTVLSTEPKIAEAVARALVDNSAYNESHGLERSVSTWAHSDFSSVMEWIEELPSDAMSKPFCAAIRRRAADDFGEAMALANSSEIEGAVEAVLEGGARAQPVKTIEAIQDRFGTNVSKDIAAIANRAIAQLATIDAHSAKDLYSESESIVAQDADSMYKTAHGIATQLALVDLPAAETWAHGLTTSSSRSAAATALSRHYLGLDNRSSIEWAVKIENTDDRIAQINNLLLSLPSSFNPVSLVRDAGISEEDFQTLSGFILRGHLPE